MPAPGQCKICKCPTPGTDRADKCPAVAPGEGGRWARVELTDCIYIYYNDDDNYKDAC